MNERQRERLSKQIDQIERMLTEYLRTSESSDPDTQIKLERLKKHSHQATNHAKEKESHSD
jgi:hypothetical protein